MNKNAIKKLFLTIIGIMITIVFLFPLFWIFTSSFKTDAEIFAIEQTIFPKEIRFDNYVDQFITASNPLRPFMNSVIIATSSMILSLLFSIPASYGLARYNIPFRKLILFVFLLTQLLPTSLILTPLFILFSKVGLINTYMAPILTTATITIPFTILVMRTIFLKAPKELAEAAMIDGCNKFQIFVKIFLPLSKPGLITAASFSFIMAWNDLIFSMTFNNKEALRPMTAGIYNFMNAYGTQWNKIMAYAVVLVIPVVIIFVVLQKYIIGGLLEGSVKG